MTTSPVFKLESLFGAYSNGVTPEVYTDSMKSSIDMLDDIENTVDNMKINSEDVYRQAYAIKELLCGVSCYTFNNKHPENDRVWKLEAKLGKKMLTWMKSQLAGSDENLLIRYILWNKRYKGDSELRKKILDTLIEKGYIVTRPAGKYNKQEVVITGIYCKVGDNTFSIARNGKSVRQFVDVCVPQCFEILLESDKEYLATKDIPMTEKEMTMTYMQDGKGCARNPKFNYKDAQRLHTMFQY